MERPAKERLIGAVVIVTVAWLLIPVFLDQGGGGDGDAVVARELALPDTEPGNGASIRREIVPLDEPQAGPALQEAPQAAPVTALPVPEASAGDAGAAPPADDDAAAGPGASADSSAEPARQAELKADPRPEPEAPEPDPRPEAEAPAPPPEPAAAPAAAAGAQLWAVQIGSFSDRDNAQRLAGQLRAQGYPAFLSQVQADGRTLHRVRIGPQASREAAADVAARLAGAGQSARVVLHP